MTENFTFREGSSDANIFTNVVEKNEYRLPDSFAPDDVILDVGSHIGSFAQACLNRGARRIYCFEPEPENFCLLRRHLAPEIATGVVVPMPLALGSPGFELRLHSGHTAIGGELNTGGGFIYERDGSCHVKQEYIVSYGIIVPKVGLDEVLQQLGKFSVRFLKLDCEHSEFELLGGSTMLGSVKEIAGEYHSYAAFTPDWMLALLSARGFQAEIVPHPDSPLGMFFGKR